MKNVLELVVYMIEGFHSKFNVFDKTSEILSINSASVKDFVDVSLEHSAF
ncbi:MAG: hypothetical protein HUJ51_04190 [Eggerthellaceae bacterium]|nr:hypothetical protein [Eggerthellaceae bacterium]